MDNIPKNVREKCIELENVMQDNGYVFIEKTSKEYKKYKNAVKYKNEYLVGIFLGIDYETNEKYYAFQRFISAESEEQAIEIFNENNGFKHKNTEIICSFINKVYCSVLNMN